jgi:ribosomal subunit interface protein
MIIQVNTDNHIAGSERQESYVSEMMQKAFQHYVDRITRLEVHLSDQNAEKEGDNDIQCKIEARLEGLPPIYVESQEENMDEALAEAVKKMQSRLRTITGKLNEKHA